MLLPNSSDVCPTDRIAHCQPVNTLSTPPGSCLTKTQVLLLPLHYSFFFFGQLEVMVDVSRLPPYRRSRVEHVLAEC